MKKAFVCTLLAFFLLFSAACSGGDPADTDTGTGIEAGSGKVSFSVVAGLPVTFSETEKDGGKVLSYYSAENGFDLRGFQYNGNFHVKQYSNPILVLNDGYYLSDWVNLNGSLSAAKYDRDLTNEPQIGGDAPDEKYSDNNLFTQLSADDNRLLYARYDDGFSEGLSFTVRFLSESRSVKIRHSAPEEKKEFYSVAWNGVDTQMDTLAPIFRDLIMTADRENLYYDLWDDAGNPAIFKATLSSENSSGTLFLSGAKHPVASSDGVWFSFMTSGQVSSGENPEWNTVLRKNGKTVKEFAGERILVMDEADGEIYVLSVNDDGVEVYSMEDLRQKRRGVLPSGWIYPQISQGKLCLFFPKEGSNLYALAKEN